MSLIGVSAKVGAGIGRHLPGVVKAASVKAPVAANALAVKAHLLAYTLTPVKATAIACHIVVTTAKIVGTGAAALIAAHWVGF